jgi:hypothetical protein
MWMSGENVAEGSIFAPSKSGNGVTIGSAVDAGYGRTTAAWARREGVHLAAADLAV